MRLFAGVIATPKSKPLSQRMGKFCDHGGEGDKPRAFCDGWTALEIDKDGVLHVGCRPEADTEIYCERLGDFRARELETGYGLRMKAGFGTLITPSDAVLDEDNGDDVQAKLEEYRKKHPDFGIYIIACHC